MMNNKENIKYFYEVIVSESLLDELSDYISEDCVQRTGEKEIFIGIDGMKQHLFCDACPKFHTGRREYYPDRHFAYDTCIYSCRIMARYSCAVSGNQISAGSF